MSYPVTDVVQLVPTTTAAASYAASLTKLSGDWANDDWIYLAVACSATSGTLSTATSGWSEVVELDVTSGVRMGVYKAKVAGGTVADPTVSLSSGTALWSAFAWIERDADATDPTPANHYGTADGGNATSFSSATLTPGAGSPVDNCRIVYFAATRSTSDNYLRMLDSSVTGDSLLNISDGTTSMAVMIGSTSQTTAAATEKTIYNSTTIRSGCITLAIKPGSGGKRAQQATKDITRLAWLGSFGAAHDGTLTPVTTSWGAPTTPRTISGVAVSATAATRITTAVVLNEWGTYDNHSCTLATAGWQGNMLTFSADVDMTGKFFALEWNSGGFASQVGDKGLIIVFEDNAGTSWEAFQLSQKTGFQWFNEYGAVIDLENATPFDSAGTLDWTLVRKVSPLLHRSGVSAAPRSFNIKNMLLVGKTTMMGGNVDKPLTINYLRQALHGMGYMGLVGGEAPAVTLRSDVQIGDTGTTTTYYDATGTLHAFPEAYDALTQREVNIPANKIDLTVDAGANDTINFTATAISATLEQNFTFASGTDAGAEYSLQGAAIIGVLPTGQTAVPQGGPTYSGCDTVAFKGADATNVSITDTTSTNAAASWDADGGSATSCTIDGTGAAYAIELGTAVTAITLTDCTITVGSLTPFDKVHVLKTTGTVTITISGTTTLASGDVTSEGATVDIVAPQPTLDATVLSGTRVVLYNNTTAAELDNTAPAGTAWSKVITSGVSANDNLTLFAFKEGYAEFSTSFLYSGDDTTILVTQVVDDVVAAFRTEDSITDYTTLTEYNIYAPTIYIQADDADGVSKISRLATYYNGVLTTEDGARYFRGGMSMISTGAVRINKGTIELLLENVSATKSLRFSDEATRRLYTDDGTSIIAPSSVAGSIEYAYGGVPDTVAVGSAVLQADIDEIVSSTTSSVFSTAQTTPIHSDVRKVVGITVDGTGTEGDPWGPA